jgi:deoxyribonuclease (pyrimidine dimer)
LGWKSRTPIPEKLALGKGHITFWRDKQLYLKRRHEALVEEMIKRGFKPNFKFWAYEDVPAEFWNDWEPTEEDSFILRERIYDRILLKPEWYRFKKRSLPKSYKDLLFNSPVVF